MIICLGTFACSTYDYKEEIKKYNISINKINLDMEYKIASMDSTIREIVMFEECGRPNIEGSNTVIGSHSGSADYAYFNGIYLLEAGDEITIIYNEKKYTYIVVEVKEIEDSEVKILESQGSSILTLLTCKIGDSSKRIVVIGNLRN